MATNLFSVAIDKFRGRPKPVPIALNVQWSPDRGIAAPVAVPIQAPVPVPTPISLEKKPADVEDIPTRFKFGMQQVTVAVHHASEVPARFLSSLVGGR